MPRRKTTEVSDPKEKINNLLPTRSRLKCKNQKQKEYANLITNNELIFCSGPAGVGKSYVAIARAIELLQNKTNKYNRIMVVNPAVEAEEKLGFIPGTVREKLEPYVASSIDIFDKIIGEKNRKALEAEGIIKVDALAFIRGKSIDGTILIMEESQNMSPGQMKTLVTRIGENTKFIISGDLDQSDRYTDFKKSGLYDAMKRFKNVEEVKMFKFDVDDVVRNPIISKLLKCYDIKEEKQNVPTPPAPPEPRLIVEGKTPPHPNNESKPPKKNKVVKFFMSIFKW